jgi:hypothetical protein
LAKNKTSTLDDVVTQLVITNRLLVAQLKRADMKQNELIKVLMSSGASADDIADVLDTTPGTVRTAIQRLKDSKKKKEADSTATA